MLIDFTSHPQKNPPQNKKITAPNLHCILTGTPSDHKKSFMEDFSMVEIAFLRQQLLNIKKQGMIKNFINLHNQNSHIINPNFCSFKTSRKQ